MHARAESFFSPSTPTTPTTPTNSSSAAAASPPGGCCLRLLLLVEVVADPALSGLVPINALRNAALLAVTSPLAAMVDVDLAPSGGLAALLRDEERVRQLQAGAHGSLWVLPAWEVSPRFNESDARRLVEVVTHGSKEVLAQMWSSHHVRIFSEDIYLKGHNATNYKRWLTASQPYNVDHERGYEPWGLVSRQRHVQHPYDIRFRGCFRDKVTHVASLAAAHVSFAVLTDAWLVHQPHAFSAAAAVAFNRSDAAAAAAAAGGDPARRRAMEALRKPISYRGVRTTKFELHKAHSMLTSDEAYALMARGAYDPPTGPQFRNCRDALPWVRERQPAA
ncbi:hypothetical protein HYH03_012070 [Edaphochlamys debaryana]|uniref:Uncharacterized protein n=1 Tax=Edaphochlamys debaryana TaxID=47281 RepID=A0A836BVU8_9CHLO|nr:hypothetical protein HYH03_012070 [Edaphochlamys debaryana]|eukprot:KAG2489433.1 hypothetical protein HYH03_012070 [Edaphochlamys debaryana]